MNFHGEGVNSDFLKYKTQRMCTGVTSWTYKTSPVYQCQEAVVADACQKPQLGKEALPEEARHKAKSHLLVNTLRTSHFWACGARAQKVRLLTCYFSWATPPALLCPRAVTCLTLWCCTAWTPASQLRFRRLLPFGIQKLGIFFCKVTWKIWSGRCAQITPTHAGSHDFSIKHGSYHHFSSKNSQKRKCRFSLLRSWHLKDPTKLGAKLTVWFRAEKGWVCTYRKEKGTRTRTLPVPHFLALLPGSKHFCSLRMVSQSPFLINTTDGKVYSAGQKWTQKENLS